MKTTLIRATRAGVLLAMVAALLAVATTTDSRTTDHTQSTWGPVTVSQAAPEPSLEDGPPRGGATLGGVRKAATDEGTELVYRHAKACPSNFRWLRRCAVAGYILRATCGTAGCGFVGVLGGAGGKLLYRADPDASRSPRDYKRGAKWTLGSRKSGPGRCTWSRKKANQAAYVLAHYGRAEGPNRESAAIDLATIHILCGAKQKKWRISGGFTNARLKKAGLGKGARKKVKKRARALVRQGLRQRGPYRLSVDAPRQTVANTTVTVTAELRGTTTKRAAVNRKLVLRLPDNSKEAAWTNGSGVATWTFTLPAGTHGLVVRAKDLEEHRLLRKDPKNRAGSRLLIAGKHHSRLNRGIVITTKNTPALNVSPEASGKIPDPVGGSFTYTNSLGTEPKRVHFELRGGYGQASTPTCTNGLTIKKASTTITENGTYSLPKLYPRDGGYYRWLVTVEGDTLNTARAACSNVVRVDRATPVIRTSDMKPVAGTVFNVGATIKPAMFRYRQGYGSGARTVRTSLYGPFTSSAEATCSSALRRKTEKKWKLKGNSRYNLIKPGKYLVAKDPGWYRFQVKAGGNDANEPAYRCGPRFRVR